MREVIPGLWIGNVRDGRSHSTIIGSGIEAIVDLAVEETPATPPRELLHFRIPLVDGSGNAANRLQLAAQTVSWLLEASVPVLVACSAGMSRSPAIAAAALAQSQELSLENALRRVAESGSCDVSPTLLSDIAAAIGE